MADQEAEELITLCRRLLESISNADWTTYTELCADDLTAFEPEGHGNLIQGLDFHQYYFDLPRPADNESVTATNTTLSAPHVRVMGHVAIVSYVRLIQSGNQTLAFEETRVWEKSSTGQWQHVHFHRSSA